jgi:uncharacterized membrane protein
MIGFVKTTVLGGILVILPLAVVALLAIEGFQISVAATRSIEGILPIRTWLGLAAFNALAVILAVSVCFGAGLLAQLTFVSKRIEKLDKGISNLVPGYFAAKEVLSGADAGSNRLEDMTPVFVELHGTMRLGFEVERTRQGLVIIYFPNSPNPQSGTVEAVSADNVKLNSLPAHVVLEDFRRYGRGFGATIDTLQASSGRFNIFD